MHVDSAASLNLACSAILVVPSISVAQSTAATRIELPYATTIEVPWGWRSTNPQVETALGSNQEVLPALAQFPGEDGTWLFVAAPSSDGDEQASVTLTVMSSDLSQSALIALSPAEIQVAENGYFLPEAQRATKNTGWRIVSWEGTRRTALGGRSALVTRYTVASPGNSILRKTTYSIYLGSRTIHVHTLAPTTAGSASGSTVERILSSLSVGVDSL